MASHEPRQDPWQDLEIEATSPEGEITVRVSTTGSVSVRVQPGALERLDEDELSTSLSAVLTSALRILGQARREQVRVIAGPFLKSSGTGER